MKVFQAAKNWIDYHEAHSRELGELGGVRDVVDKVYKYL